MIEIRHKETGALLHQLDQATLERADLTRINLCGADLTGMNLAGAVLAGSVCRGARFNAANLAHADMRGAYLLAAEFRDADLSGALLFSDSLDSADLTGANLSGANLTGAYCAEAKLTRANLCYANLQSTYLAGADLTGARLAFTLFADCPSLFQASGLDQIEHVGPSSLDRGTLRPGIAGLPAVFLQGAGLAKEEIAELRTQSARSAGSPDCFLAFAAADAGFAARLRADLLAHGVSCWPFPADLHAGYVLQIVFNHAVRRQSRLLLLCSEAAMREGAVLAAAQNVTGHKPETDRPQPFLLLLDDFPRRAGPSLGAEDATLAVWNCCLRHCPTFDFPDWRQGERYSIAFERLLEAVRS